MPRSRKTRTKSTSHEVAFEAARILATEGQNNYQAAKTKAAERLGLGKRPILPANHEVKRALHDYLALYGGTAHLENLAELRQIALDTMNELSEFQPRLVGGVLDGTATHHSHIGLHVFCDSPDDLVIWCLDRNLEFHQTERRIRWHDGSYRRMAVVELSRSGRTLELMVFNRIDLRQTPPSPIDGKPQVRATVNELRALISPADQ